MVRFEAIRASTFPLITQLRKLRGSFERKPPEEIAVELGKVKNFLDQWALALLMDDAVRALQVSNDLALELAIDEKAAPLSRKQGEGGIVENHIIKTCFELDFILQHIQPTSETVFIGPLSTGSLMTVAVTVTLRNIGVMADWVPAYVSLDEKRFMDTVVPIDPSQTGQKNFSVIDDGYSQPFNVIQSDPKRTAGAISFKLNQLREGE